MLAVIDVKGRDVLREFEFPPDVLQVLECCLASLRALSDHERVRCSNHDVLALHKYLDTADCRARTAQYLLDLLEFCPGILTLRTKCVHTDGVSLISFMTIYKIILGGV